MIKLNFRRNADLLSSGNGCIFLFLQLIEGFQLCGWLLHLVGNIRRTNIQKQTSKIKEAVLIATNTALIAQ